MGLGWAAYRGVRGYYRGTRRIVRAAERDRLNERRYQRRRDENRAYNERVWLERQGYRAQVQADNERVRRENAEQRALLASNRFVTKTIGGVTFRTFAD